MAFGRQLSQGATGSARHPLPPSTEAAVNTTLLELVRTIGEITDDESEIVATVVHMLRSGSVKLIGSFRNTPANRFLD